MKPELANIISALISNIGHNSYDYAHMIAKQAHANQTAEGISKLGELWPNLTNEEKQEIKAVVEAVKTSNQEIHKRL